MVFRGTVRLTTAYTTKMTEYEALNVGVII